MTPCGRARSQKLGGRGDRTRTLSRGIAKGRTAAVALLALAGVVHADPGATPDAPGPEMVRIPGGSYTIGTDDRNSMRNERPARQVEVETFWMDVTPVTNAQFKRFVEATGYVTTAERPIDWQELKKQLPPGTPKPPEENLRPGAITFVPPEHAVPLEDLSQWFKWTDGASWRAPEGPGSDIEGRMDHPVVQVSWDDAQAYAKWAGKRLPTEAEWEVAARGGLKGKRFFWGDEFMPDGKAMANTFTGTFPHKNTASDGFAGRAPVASFPANGYGLHDMAGNVWQWTADIYTEKPGMPPRPGDPRRVMKGGSYLCHVDYCESYRPSARRGTPYDTGTCHLGFRCVSDTPPADPADEAKPMPAAAVDDTK